MPIPDGTRVIKVNSEEGDNHPDGSKGTVLWASPPLPREETASDGRVFPAGARAYYVEWDGSRERVLTLDYKLKAEEPQ